MMETVEKIDWMLNQPERWDFSGTENLYAGVDLGTYKTIVIVIDDKGSPRAANLRRAEVVKSGLIVDYIRALDIVRELMDEIRNCSPLKINKGATSFPPQTETANINTTKYILESVDLEVLSILDEPSAARLALNIRDGAIVDVGGGTTGVAVIKDGEVIYTNDEATGGEHLSLVLAGRLNISYEEADQIKLKKENAQKILPIVQPVIEKISSIVESFLKNFAGIKTIYLAGGTCALDGLSEIVSKNLHLETFRPKAPQFITPFGIALSCLTTDGHKAEAGKWPI